MTSRRKFILEGATAAGAAIAGAAYWSETRSRNKVMASAGPSRFSSTGGVVDVELTASAARFPLAGEVCSGGLNGQALGR